MKPIALFLSLTMLLCLFTGCSSTANEDLSATLDAIALSLDGIEVSLSEAEAAAAEPVAEPAAEPARNTEASPREAAPAFTNAYGSSTTKCAHSGCDNPIASSGDTNCCTLHSNRCLECNCYIDEDAMYCMDCLTGAITGNGSTKSNSSTYSYSFDDDDDYSYDYDMPEAGESFSDYVQRVDPDLYSDMEDILNSLY